MFPESSIGYQFFQVTDGNLGKKSRFSGRYIDEG